MRSISPAHRRHGFTLIEVLMAVVIVAILASVAFPSYVDYVRRGKITQATTALATMRVQMEQYFQDNRTYANVAGVPAPCSPGAAVGAPPNARYFTFSCDTPARTANTYTLTATGRADAGMGGFVYTVNETNTQASVITGAASTAGFVSNASCWVVRKG
ncbi:MAG TPA: type IV pilin protein, partial [Burkholderiales bacterium]|nr:type IV pilin protein [Burkholderiales bacterium]